MQHKNEAQLLNCIMAVAERQEELQPPLVRLQICHK
jgi:hypothetical protein